MPRLQVVRLGAVSALLYFLLFVVEQVYSSRQPRVPTNLPKADDALARVLLTFFHQHPGWLSGQILFGVAGFVLLAGVVVGVYALLSYSGARLARTSLFVGVGSCGLSIVTSIYFYLKASSSVDRYAAARTVIEKRSAIDEYIHLPAVVQFIDVLSATLLNGLLWLAIVGVCLIRLYGNRSLLGWVTIGAALLTMYPILPALPLWCAAAAYYLVRWSLVPAPASAPAPAGRNQSWNEASGSDALELQAAAVPRPRRREHTIEPPIEAVSTQPPQSRARGTSESRQHPTAARGSKTGRRKRR